MARKTKPQEFAHKRNSILDAAQRLVYIKGYERMTIQDILQDVQISSGAFYHYFDSKPAVLEAFIERMKEESEKVLLPVIRNPNLSAPQKLQGFFTALDRSRIGQKDSVVELLRVWYTDDNAIVRQKVDEAVFRQRAPLLTEIVQQGLAEGAFTTPHTHQAGAVILSLLHGMAHVHATLLLTFDRDGDELHTTQQIITSQAAYLDAIERVLGATPFLFRAEPEAVEVWLAALRRTNTGGEDTR